MESRVWKPYSPYQFRPLRKITPHRRVRLIHSSLACKERNNAPGPDLIQCFCKKIIMDKKIMLCIPSVKDLIIPKWYISHGNIKKIIWILFFFKSFDRDFSIRIKQPCYPAGYTVFFHPVQSAASKFIRQCSKKMPDACRWL